MRNLLARSTLVVLVILLDTTPGQTSEPLTPANSALSDAAIEQRIDFIEQRLDSHETHGRSGTGAGWRSTAAAWSASASVPA